MDDLIFYILIIQILYLAALASGAFAIVLLIKSIVHYSQTGPQLRKKVLLRYRFYLAFSLLRLTVATFLLASILMIPGAVVYLLGLAMFGGSYSDIIQINSKSGLTGSHKNFAYAGSKFGSIGLVQSFAMELVTHGIKVNAICPGNYFDGPLWSDPDKGLFSQYLKAGKVKGARNIVDVRRYYEEKVPMKRGIEIVDIMRAIYYVVEQNYETGQAIPVTGGQIMLH